MKRSQKQATIRAAIYLRVSTEEQAKAYGLDAQLAECRRKAELLGWTIATEYKDAGISGTKDATERPALAELLGAVAAGEIDAVIVYALDRLARKTLLALQLVAQISDAGAALVSCKEELDTSSPMGKFALTLMAALAQLERDKIVERTTAGRNQRGQKDGYKGGQVYYGYRQQPAAIVVDEQEAATVRLIYALKAQGLSLRKIAAELEARAIPTPRGGAQWYATSVRVILSKEAKAAYRGGLRGDSSVHWPAILA